MSVESGLALLLLAVLAVGGCSGVGQPGEYERKPDCRFAASACAEGFRCTRVIRTWSCRPVENLAGVQAKADPGDHVTDALEAPDRSAKPKVPLDLVNCIRIDGRLFMMGTTNGHPRTRPVHVVSVPTLDVARTETTVAQYRACVIAGTCGKPTGCDMQESTWRQEGLDEHPVNCVSWQQANVFCKWTGGRLLSEAEWEYAARGGGRKHAFPWGSEKATCERVVMNEGGEAGDVDSSGPGCDKGRTWPACSMQAGNTKQGLCDMAGNVREWVEDCQYDNYEGAPEDANPWTVLCRGSYRVTRGGGFYDGVADLRATSRNWSSSSRTDRGIGFRCAKSVGANARDAAVSVEQQASKS